MKSKNKVWNKRSDSKKLKPISTGKAVGMAVGGAVAAVTATKMAKLIADA